MSDGCYTPLTDDETNRIALVQAIADRYVTLLRDAPAWDRGHIRRAIIDAALSSGEIMRVWMHTLAPLCDEAMDKALVDLAVYLYHRETMDDPAHRPTMMTADHLGWLRETCARYEGWLQETVEIATVSPVE